MDIDANTLILKDDKKDMKAYLLVFTIELCAVRYRYQYSRKLRPKSGDPPDLTEHVPLHHVIVELVNVGKVWSLPMLLMVNVKGITSMIIYTYSTRSFGK